MSQRYILRRIDGSWKVLDSQFNDFVMGDYGAGSQGNQLAQAVADGLNEQPRAKPTTTPTDGLRSSAGLRAWRRAHGLSQTALGKMLDVTYKTVVRWETGQVPIPRTVELALLYLEQSLPEPELRAAV